MRHWNPFIRTALLLATLMLSLTGHAQSDATQIRGAIESYLRQQTADLPGKASFSVSSLEAGAARPTCTSLDVSMAPGARSIGRTTVLVQCRGATPWAIYVPVQIHMIADYLVSSRPLGQGQLLSEADLARQSGDLGDLPSGILQNPAQIVGRITAVPIPAGKPFVAELLRQAPVIQAGQTVKVISRGDSFEVSSDGRALTAAAEGKVVQVRLSNGQTISGIARAGGIVEITF